MGQWSRPLVAILEEPSSIPNTHMVAYSWGSDTFLWPPQAPVIPRGTHACRKDTHTHKIKFNLIFEKESFWIYILIYLGAGTMWDSEVSVKVTGQFGEIFSLFLPWGSWDLNLSHQAWQHSLLVTEPSH